jgi:hypothetical protein
VCCEVSSIFAFPLPPAARKPLLKIYTPGKYSRTIQIFWSLLITVFAVVLITTLTSGNSQEWFVCVVVVYLISVSMVALYACKDICFISIYHYPDRMTAQHETKLIRMCLSGSRDR